MHEIPLTCEGPGRLSMLSALSPRPSGLVATWTTSSTICSITPPPTFSLVSTADVHLDTSQNWALRYPVGQPMREEIPSTSVKRGVRTQKRPCCSLKRLCCNPTLSFGD